MVARGEVALIVDEKVGALVSDFTTAIIFMIILTSIFPPILLKLLFENSNTNDTSLPNETTNP